jgi:hypothetical protein
MKNKFYNSTNSFLHKDVPKYLFKTSFFLQFAVMLVANGLWGQTQSFLSNGTFTVPVGITSISVQAWGGGAAGATGTGRGGGGGGAFATKTISTSAGSTFAVVIGTGGTPTSAATRNGTSSTFGSTQVIAVGGAGTSNNGGGAGGAGGSCTPTIGAKSGGNGGSSSATSGDDDAGGGGGGSATSAVNGGTGGNGTATTQGTGGTGQGAGGAGADDVANAAAVNGSVPGGGGGGRSESTGSTSGNGASGQIIVTWTCNPTITRTSALSTISQSICSGSGIAPITYAIGGTATGGTVSGLPSGVSGTFSAGVFTISGTPLATGSFNYTVTTTTSNCTNATASGTIMIATPMTVVTGQSNVNLCTLTSLPVSITTSGTISSYSISATGGYSSVVIIGNTLTFNADYSVAVDNYSVTLTGAGGCQVVQNFIITRNPSTSNATSASACDAYTWAVNGTTYTASGTYTNVVGCHTETLTLTITPSTSNATSTSACDAYTWAVNGTTYTASGTYNNVVGCHTETLTLTITPSTSNTTTVSVCDNYIWQVNSTTYTLSGTYTDVVDCHTETLVLTITPSTSNTTTVSVCDNYFWQVNSTTYSVSGTYTNVVGCHTETLVLTITPSTSNSTTASACDNYTWSVNSTTYTLSGTYTNVIGCHTETLVLTIGCIVSGNLYAYRQPTSTIGVGLADVNLTGASTGSTSTPASGAYSFTVLTTGGLTITPTKNINRMNGVDAADVLRIKQHQSGANPITDGYVKIAADVNKSNSITSVDVALINSAILGLPTLPFNTSWRFVPISHIINHVTPWTFPEAINFSGLSSDLSNQNFYGLKLGDVTESSNPSTLSASIPMTFNVQDKELVAGEMVEIDFNLHQIPDLAAFQFALQIDPNHLEYIAVSTSSAFPITTGDFGTVNIADGELRVLWSLAQGLEVSEQTPIFHLKLKALSTGQKLSELISINDLVMGAKSFSTNLEEKGVLLNFQSVSGTVNPFNNNGVQLYQNTPNPFSENTNIGFSLPISSEARLSIYDGMGRLIFEQNGQFASGFHNLLVDFKNQTASGILYYNLTTPQGNITKKMIHTQK